MYFSIPYMIVALTSFASTVDYLDLNLDIFHRLRLMQKCLANDEHGYPKEQLPIWLERLQGIFGGCGLFSIYWTYVMMLASVLLNFTTFNYHGSAVPDAD